MTTLSSTVAVLPGVDIGRPFSDVRCYRCKRLLMKWQWSGLANIEIKCPRCGTIDVIRLSTS